MEAFEVSAYQPHDQEPLLLFFREVLTDLGWGFDPKARHQDLLHIRQRYDGTGGCFLLARSSQHIVGTIALRKFRGQTFELKRFFVLKSHRNRGLGKLLLQTLIDRAKTNRIGAIRLDTSSKSPAAIALFKAHGFIEIPRYNDDPYAELFMELRLA